MRYRVRHQTAYEYGSDVVHSQQLLHLVPRPSPYQQCIEHSLRVLPETFIQRDETDAFGNLVTRVEIEHAHRQLDIATDMEVEVHPRPAVSAIDTLPWEEVRDLVSYSGGWPSREVLDAARFRHESPYVRVKQVFNEYGADCFQPGRPILACAQALMEKLHRELRYAPGETSIATPLAEVLQNRRGVCQDFAHLMIACLRARSLPARYVSGYIRLRAEQMDWVDAGASHAWVSVYSPPFGWLELDPTNNVHVGTDHIAVAWGRDFGDVSPLRGVILGGGTHTLTVKVTVEPLGS